MWTDRFLNEGNHGAGQTAPEDRQKHMAEDAQAIGYITKVNGAGATLRCPLDRFLQDSDGEEEILPAGQIGAMVKVKVDKGYVFCTVCTVEMVGDSQSDAADVILTVEFLGHGVRAPRHPAGMIFDRGISAFPLPGAKVYEVSVADVEAIFGINDNNHMQIGTIYPHHLTPASLKIDAMLGKHFAVLGSTGTGKSCSVALLIHRIVERLPNGHILILDPHNEYASAFADCGEHFDITNLQLPYWLMNFEEHVELFIGSRMTAEREVEVDILRRAIHSARVANAEGMSADKITVDTPVPYKLTYMLEYLDTEMGKLEKAVSLTPFLRLRSKIEELRRDNRFNFMFSGLLVHDNLRSIIGRILRFPVDGKPVSTIDLSGVPSEIVNVVVSVLSRLVFDFALWSRGEDARPILLVCEEAHRYVPNDSQIKFESTRKSIERIAKEGRKYGVSLGLVSQRPADVSESALSQCGTIIALRMNNERDQRFVEHVMPESAQGALTSLSALQNREGIVVGEGANAPMRIQFDRLDENLLPSGKSPSFSKDWQAEIENESFILDSISRWRRQGR